MPRPLFDFGQKRLDGNSSPVSKPSDEGDVLLGLEGTERATDGTVLFCTGLWDSALVLVAE